MSILPNSHPALLLSAHHSISPSLTACSCHSCPSMLHPALPIHPCSIPVPYLPIVTHTSPSAPAPAHPCYLPVHPFLSLLHPCPPLPHPCPLPREAQLGSAPCPHLPVGSQVALSLQPQGHLVLQPVPEQRHSYMSRTIAGDSQPMDRPPRANTAPWHQHPQTQVSSCAHPTHPHTIPHCSQGPPISHHNPGAQGYSAPVPSIGAPAPVSDPWVHPELHSHPRGHPAPCQHHGSHHQKDPDHHPGVHADPSSHL